MLSKFGNLFLVLAISLIAHASLLGQSIDIQLSNTYFIKNATIIQKPGQVLEMGSIIIKDGVIHSVGKDLKAPADANIIDADSMYIYAGFIDAFNNTGVKRNEEERGQQGARGGARGNNPRVANPDNAPDDIAGITPERSLSDVFEQASKTTSGWREAGFTASLSAPIGGMLPGQASIILHSDHPADGAIVKKDFALVGTFESAPRVYPATVIGVMAKYKDMFRQAGYSLTHEKAYGANPVGMARPAYDEGIRALYPVVEGEKSLIMDAQKVKDISRALALQKDLGFPLYLANVKQGDFHLEAIKSGNIPVIISLDIPHADKKEAKGGDGKMKEGKKDEKEEEAKKEEKEEEKDPEKEALQARKDEAIKAYQSQAGIFANAGIPISFSGKDAKEKDIKKNLKAMMENGLTEDQALSALTTNPAELYGVSNIMGTVENGKIANLFIADGPYFEDDSNIKYVFVEGKQYEYEIKKKSKTTDGEAGSDLSGKYSYTIDVPGDTRKGYMNVSKHNYN